MKRVSSLREEEEKVCFSGILLDINARQMERGSFVWYRGYYFTIIQIAEQIGRFGFR